MDPQARLQEALQGHYRLVRELGEGGMAIVFLADDLKHPRQVAVKVLRPEVTWGSAYERFRREIEIASGLNHPNVLPLHDSGEVDGLPYFVMPYVDGESLRARLDREGGLPLEEVLRVADEVGDALTYAHGRGLVHRDIKPENILLQAGHALVSDFGIAQLAQGDGGRLTGTGQAVGTLAYMSPEQFEGEKPVDQRADVYALGCMLHEMLSGERPFAAGSPQATLARKLTGTLTDLTTTRADVPPTVQSEIERAVSVDPALRHATAGELVTALRAAVTIRAQEAYRIRKRRRTLLRRALAGTGTVALAAAAWWAFQGLNAPRMERIAVLPFRNAEADTSQDFYVAGFHHDMVVELAKAVRVINPSSVARYAGTTLPTRQIADELGVDGVMDGSVDRRPDLVTLSLQLVDPGTEEIIWSRTFRSSPGNVVGLYHDVARAIAGEMGVRLTPDVLARLPVSAEVDPQVYDLLVQARFHLEKLTPTGFDTAERYYQLALERDSLSAEAWQGLATVWLDRAQQGLVSGAEAKERAAPYSDRAALLDPTLPAVQADRAVQMAWSEWRFRDALDAFRTALDDDPTNSLLRVAYSQVLLYLDRDDEALKEAEQAADLDPFNTMVQGFYAQDLNFLRRYGDAEAVLERVRAADPDAPYVLSTLRTTYHLMGREGEAMEMWRASYRAAEDTAALSALDAGYAQGGYASALRAVAELFVARSKTEYVTPWQIATLYTRAGDAEPALDYLELAYKDHDQNMPSIAVDPIFDFIRNRPRFQALVDSLGLPRES
ncbi:MAG: protein kinase [Gemmatimonadetes bacterium]|nr:protein kinase [Gemmatimonadota bacterium]